MSSNRNKKRRIIKNNCSEDLKKIFNIESEKSSSDSSYVDEEDTDENEYLFYEERKSTDDEIVLSSETSSNNSNNRLDGSCEENYDKTNTISNSEESNTIITQFSQNKEKKSKWILIKEEKYLIEYQKNHVFSKYFNEKEFRLGASKLQPNRKIKIFFYSLFDTKLLNFFKEIQLSNIGKNKHKIKQYFAVILLTTLNKKPYIRDHWSKNEYLKTVSVQKIMSRQNFLKIHSGWSFSKNNRNVDDLINLVNINIKNVYSPSYRVVLDESLIPSKCRSKNRVYIPRKPRSDGFRVWNLTDQNKYVWHIKLFEKNVKSEPVIQLIKRMIGTLPKNQDFHLYADKYFSSLKNIYALLQLKRFNFTFSVRKDRPSQLFKKFLHRGIKIHSSKIAKTVIKKKDIFACSISDQNKNKQISLFNCITTHPYFKNNFHHWKPDLILDYVKYMRFVDVFDQMISNYHFDYKIRSWKLRIMLWTFILLIHNSRILYSIKNKLKKIYPMKEWIIEIIKILSQTDENDKTHTVSFTFKAQTFNEI
ncbi:piggybac transposable element-derived protein [Anaeramoeba flamelloides]|uniref:Piggybac transposable element-derived protein n=1 Tax=Anaeramoeba flamelloides TaxID=1746091 RepID=A0AAV7YTJ2_9EUKA|nr:piggybac transposable element-derived protein [Anaeramoeba flamelloides]